MPMLPSGRHIGLSPAPLVKLFENASHFGRFTLTQPAYIAAKFGLDNFALVEPEFYEPCFESHYKAPLAAICGGRTPDSVEKLVEADVVLEDSNPYDNQVVRAPVGKARQGLNVRVKSRRCDAGHV